MRKDDNIDIVQLTERGTPIKASQNHSQIDAGLKHFHSKVSLQMGHK
jgi:hypothetical protein